MQPQLVTNIKPVNTSLFRPFDGDAVTSDSFREAMSYMAAAVNIVTSDGPAGIAGFTASSVCSVSLDPPTLLVCLGKGASVAGAFLDNGVLCVNTLAARHSKLCTLFGGKTPVDERFGATEWQRCESGSPALADAMITHDCRIDQAIDAGTHHILLCEVMSTRIKPDESLVYYKRGFHSL